MCQTLGKLFMLDYDGAKKFGKTFVRMIKTKKYGARYSKLCFESVAKLSNEVRLIAYDVSMTTVQYLQNPDYKTRAVGVTKNAMLLAYCSDSDVKALYDHDNAVYGMMKSYAKDNARKR
jgi:hypothetical protein